jgi:hypothetical protein
MKYIGTVNVLEPNEDLIQKVLAMIISQHLWRFDNLLQVGIE